MGTRRRTRRGSDGPRDGSGLRPRRRRAGAADLPGTAGILRRAAALLAAVLVACSPAEPPEGLSPTDLFEWARERHEAGEYAAAANGFQRYVLREPLSPRADSAQYMVGEAYLQDGRERLAVGEFERFVTSRPGSPLADDAQFGLCRAYWSLSPALPLEQTDTESAVEECTRLLQFFSDSPLREEAERIRGRARAKLAGKDYRIGLYYFDDGLYESANIFFESALERDPDAPVAPDVLAKLYESYRRVGFEAEATAVRRRLLEEYPDSEAARRLAEDGTGAPGATASPTS